jgi:predicted ferric reductase
MTAGTMTDGQRQQSGTVPASRDALIDRYPAATPFWWRDVAGILAWASMLVVVALWVSNRGLQNLTTLGGGITSLGRLVGLISADLLLIQVLLMARIPLIEKVYGQDELAVRHRTVGFWSFNLMLGHIALMILGYSITEHVNVIRQTWNFAVDYPGMLLAVGATVMLCLVVFTSIKKARAKLRYESWHLIHLYAYLGVGLSIPHEVWTGADFTSSRIAQLYWWGLYLAAAGAIVHWRVILPLVRSRSTALTVSRVVREGPGVVSVVVRGKGVGRLGAQAGQFFTWRFVDGPGWTRGHPYSLSAVPTENELRITVKNLGDDSARLVDVSPGSKVLVEGPYGRLHSGVRTRSKVTLMASGIGITPLRALLEGLPQNPGDVTLIYRASTLNDLVLRDEIDAVAARTGARVFYVLGRRLRGRATWLPETAGHLDDARALRQLVPDIQHNDVYLCGNQAWMDAAKAAALTCGVPVENIHTELFGW